MTESNTQSSSPGSLWTLWGIRLVALVMVATAISLAVLWVNEFYIGNHVNATLSYFARDKPWLPANNQASPIIGFHYFGDFQLPYNWGLNIRDALSPYVSTSPPANYPPLLILLYVPLTLLTVKTATLLFLVLSAAIVLVPLWLLLSPLPSLYRCIILIPIAIVSTPFITMLDRGNSISLCVGFTSCAFVACRSKRWIWCGVFLSAACALTVFPVLILVIPLAYRRYRFTVAVLSAAIVVNLMALLFIPGGYVNNLRTVVPAMSSGVLGHGSLLATWSLYSVVPKLGDLLVGPNHISQLLSPSRFWSWLPAVVYLVLVFLVIRLRRVPEWCWGPLSLATIQLVLPFSAAYTTGWACLAAIWFAHGSLLEAVSDPLSPTTTSASESRDTVLRVLVLLTLIATLVPASIAIPGAGGGSVIATSFLSPALLFVTLCVAIARSINRNALDPSLQTSDTAQLINA